MNFNLDFKVDKVMQHFSESKALRVWSYIIAAMILSGVFICNAASILTAITPLIMASK